jgi:hypothetical protein
VGRSLASLLYSYIRKLSKAKAALYPDRPFKRVPGYYDMANEILSWRTRSPLHVWFTDLISNRETPLLDGTGWRPAPVPLEEPDLLALKFEMTFGDLFRKHYESEWGTSHSPEMQRSIASLHLSAVDHLIRVSQRNRSYILYAPI